MSHLSHVAMAEEVRSKMHVVAIGVSDYLHETPRRAGDLPMPDLNYADDDARGVIEALKSHDMPDVELTLLADGAAPDMLPTHKNVMRTLQEAVKKPTDSLVIMFFGHGVDVHNTSHLCMSDTTISRLGTKYNVEKGLAVQQLFNLLAEANATSKVILTDACRNLGTDKEEIRNYDIGKYLKDQQVGQYCVISSCLPSQVAVEHDALGHGVFANFLIEGLRGNCDYDKGNRDGVVGLQELFYYTVRRTTAYALEKCGRKQLPYILMGGTQEIAISQLSPKSQEDFEGKYKYVSFDAKSFSYEQQMALEQYSMALDSFGMLELNNCIDLLTRVLEVMPNYVEAIRLRAVCYTLNGDEVNAIEDMKKLRRTLKASVFANDSGVLGIRDPKQTSNVLINLSPGDSLEIANYSNEGTNSRGEKLPAGKYLYVSRLKKKGEEEWQDAKGVIFADAIKPRDMNELAQRIQDGQREFGSTRIQSKEEILQKTGGQSRGLSSNLSRAEKIQTAVVVAGKGMNLASAIRSGNATSITFAAIDIAAPNAAPKVRQAYDTYARIRSFIPF
jgi:hypothetical protein